MNRTEGTGRPGRRVAVPVGVGVLLFSFAVSSSEVKKPLRPPSLLLISVDTLRADHVHAYGYPRPTTPTLDALAGQGVRFTRAWAHSPWTLPSHATMLSGTHPFRHGVVDDGTMLRPTVPLLAPILKAKGYATAGVVSGFYVSSRFGFERGFDRWEDFGLARGARPRDSVRAEEVTARAIEEIGRAGERPFFLFVHYFDCHNDYDAPPPWNRAFDEDTTVVRYLKYEYYRSHPLPGGALSHVVAQYDEELLYVDAMIGRLLKALEAKGRREDVVIVLTSDHGEEFFEHGSWGHGNSLYSQVMRVPLIVAGPGVPKGEVRSDFVRHLDLAPTMLDLLSLPAVAEMQGKSFAAMGTGSSGPAEAGGRFLLTETSRFRSNQVGSVDGREALIVDIAGGRAEAYDLDRDPEEKNDLAPSRPDEVARMQVPLSQAILDAVADRWVVSWAGGASGAASIEGLLLPARAAGAAGAGGPITRLKVWNSIGPAGEERLASVPPDAPIEFLVRCGGTGPSCVSVGGVPVEAAPSARDRANPSRTGPGTVRFRIDPVVDGAKLRETPGATERKSAGPVFRVRLESRGAPPSPTRLTPEEIERLKALGYAH